MHTGALRDSTAVRYCSTKAAFGEAHLDAGCGWGGGAVLEDGAGLVGDDGVAAIQDRSGLNCQSLAAELLERRCGCARRQRMALARRPRGPGRGGGGRRRSRGRKSKYSSRASSAPCAGRGARAARGAIAHAEFQFVDALQAAAYAPVQHVPGRRSMPCWLQAPLQHRQAVAHGLHRLARGPAMRSSRSSRVGRPPFRRRPRAWARAGRPRNRRW